MGTLSTKRPSRTTGETNPDKARALAAVAKTKTYRLSVDLDEPIYMETKERALQEKRKGSIWYETRSGHISTR